MELKNKITVNKSARKNNYNISKFQDKSPDRFNRGFSNYSNYSNQGRLRRYKKVWITLGIIFCAGIILFFSRENSDNFNIGKSDKIQTYVYYSRGSRDEERKEQYIFKINDPIQIKIDFKNMNDGDIVTISLKKIDSDEVKYSVEVPVDREEGNRFITLPPTVRKESSEYKAEVFMKIKDDTILLGETEFEII